MNREAAERARRGRERSIIKALNDAGESGLALGELGRATNLDHTTLHTDLGSLTAANLLVRDVEHRSLTAKRTRYRWRLAKHAGRAA